MSPDFKNKEQRLPGVGTRHKSLGQNSREKNTEAQQVYSSKESMQKAFWFIYHREYDKAKKLLFEVITNRDADSHRVFYMLGIIYFNENDIQTAKKHFLTALTKEASHINSMLYIAVIEVLSDNKAEAIRNLLEAHKNLRYRSRNKNSKYIKRALEYIKNYSQDEDSLIQIFSEPFKNKILPQFGVIYKKRKVIRNTILYIVLFSSLLAVLSYAYFNKIVPGRRAQNERSLIISDIDEKIKLETFKELGIENARVSLTDREYASLLNNIENNFINYKDNLVWIDANIILFSDRLPKDKTKVEYITQNLKGTDYTSDTRWFDYDEVIVSPWKYNNVVVNWKGTIAKVETLEGDIAEKFSYSSQFLLNFYGDNKELKASLLAYFPKDIEVHNGDEIELLAKIKLENPEDKNNNAFYLEVNAFRYIIPPSNAPNG